MTGPGLPLKVAYPGLQTVEAENPYWRAYGVIVLDPDGYRVVLTAPPGE